MNIPESWPDVPCQCEEFCVRECICPKHERALRAWAYGRAPRLMTPEERQFCDSQIAGIEGYESGDGGNGGTIETDAILAKTTLSAWVDYCRDKGLL